MRSRIAGRRRQAGAVAVLAAIAAGAGLVALALAIDVGRLYAAQRELQRAANLAALDSARVSGGCMGLVDDAQAVAYRETLDSIARNEGRRSQTTPLRVELGREFVGADGRRYFDVASEKTNHAVRVTLTRPAPARLLPLTPATGVLTAVAAARSQPSASVFVGSRLAQLEPDMLNRFFEDAFGSGAPNVGVLGYTSLFEATVPVDAIIDTPPERTPDFIGRRTVPVTELLHGLVDTLTDLGNDAAASAAEQLQAAADASSGVVPEDIVDVERDASALLGSAPVNAGDVTVLIGQAAAEQQGALIEMAYALPPPLGDSTVLVRIVDPGRIAVLTPGAQGEGEPRFASNTQALLQVSLGVPLNLLGNAARLPLWIQIAQATARVTDIECARNDQPRDIVHVDARSSVGRIGIGQFDDISAPAPAPQATTLIDTELPGGLPGLPVPLRVTVTVSALVDIPSAREDLEFSGPPFPTAPQTVGSASAAALYEAMTQLPSRLELDVDISPVAGLPPDSLAPGAVEAAESALAQGLRGEIADALRRAVDPVLARALEGVGLTLGGADVVVYGVVAKEPYLFTR